MLDHLGEEYLKVSPAGRERELPRCVREKKRFGFTHADLGMRIASSWKLPDDVGLAIKHHHDSLSTLGEHPKTLIVALADQMAHCVQEGASPDGQRNGMSRIILRWLGLSSTDLDHVRNYGHEVLPTIVL